MNEAGSWKTEDEDTQGVNQGHVACAHLTVKWRTETYADSTRGCWECTDCQAKFCPSSMASAYERTAKEAQLESALRYKQGFRDGYDRRHDEVLGAMA